MPSPLDDINAFTAGLDNKPPTKRERGSVAAASRAFVKAHEANMMTVMGIDPQQFLTMLRTQESEALGIFSVLIADLAKSPLVTEAENSAAHELQKAAIALYQEKGSIMDRLIVEDKAAQVGKTMWE